jgi:AsmA protein
MLPDPQSLIRRSGAAAPLLNSPKPRNASDAVHAVIDQLLSAAPTPGTKAGTTATTPAVSPASAPLPPKSPE